MKKKNRIFIIVLSVLLISGIIGGYAVGFSRPSTPNSEGQNIGTTTNVQTDKETENINEVRESLLKTGNMGNVDIGIEFMNPIEGDDEYLIFKTQFNTHSVELDQYDFGKIATFKTSDSIELKKEIIWEKVEGEGHHYFGYYKVPKVISGKPVITENTEFIELTLSGIDNTKSRSFKWEKDVL